VERQWIDVKWRRGVEKVMLSVLEKQWTELRLRKGVRTGYLVLTSIDKD
jgi:hypothetical protein